MDASRHCSPRSQLYLQDEQTKSRRRCSADKKIMSFHRYKTYFARLKKNFPRLQYGSSHVMRKIINRGDTFLASQGPETVKKGHDRRLPVLPVIYRCSVNCNLCRGLWPTLFGHPEAWNGHKGSPQVPASTTCHLQIRDGLWPALFGHPGARNGQKGS